MDQLDQNLRSVFDHHSMMLRLELHYPKIQYDLDYQIQGPILEKNLIIYFYLFLIYKLYLQL